MANQKLSNNSTITSALKKQATILNKELLQASNELIEGSVATAEKWQNLTEKVLKTGLKMFGKQQDMLITALEATKGQLDVSTKRFNKLVGKKPKKAKKEVVEATYESDLTIDSVMEAATVKVKKAPAPKNKVEVVLA